MEILVTFDADFVWCLVMDEPIIVYQYVFSFCLDEKGSCSLQGLSFSTNSGPKCETPIFNEILGLRFHRLSIITLFMKSCKELCGSWEMIPRVDTRGFLLPSIDFNRLFSKCSMSLKPGPCSVEPLRSTTFKETIRWASGFDQPAMDDSARH